MATATTAPRDGQPRGIDDARVGREVQRAIQHDVHIPLYLARVRDALDRAGLHMQMEDLWGMFEEGIHRQLDRDWQRMEVDVRDGVVTLRTQTLPPWEKRAVASIAEDVPGVRAVVDAPYDSPYL